MKLNFSLTSLRRSVTEYRNGWEILTWRDLAIMCEAGIIRANMSNDWRPNRNKGISRDASADEGKISVDIYTVMLPKFH